MKCQSKGNRQPANSNQVIFASCRQHPVKPLTCGCVTRCDKFIFALLVRRAANLSVEKQQNLAVDLEQSRIVWNPLWYQQVYHGHKQLAVAEDDSKMLLGCKFSSSLTQNLTFLKKATRDLK